MYSEGEFLPISALQHYVFCPRQCALIHVERIWDENRLTAEGRIMHERVHSQGTETERNVRIARGLRLRSFRLGLIGIADIVEFHRVPLGTENIPENRLCSPLPGLAGRWRTIPIEYKRGKPKLDLSDAVQVCAQALCLEEMLECAIEKGALFYGKTRHRKEVQFDADLRAKTEALALELHGFIESKTTPIARYESKCDSCSIVGMCMPGSAGSGKRVDDYLAGMLAHD